jgi:D-alanyl-D-alanine carboxypeptidase (penicillin-binding protein 5/6)
MPPRRKRHGICFAVAALLLLPLLADSVLAETVPPKVTASSVYVLGATDGVLYRKGDDKPARLHSLTKLMTAYVLIGEMGDRLTETVTIAPSHLASGASAGLRKGDVWTLADLLTGMLLVSGNDAANAIADAAGGAMLAKEGKKGDPRKRFVKAMNATAASLGAKGACFADPSGLSPENIAGSADMAAIGAAAFGDERLRPFWACAQRSLVVEGPAKRTIPLKSTVEIIGQEGILGAKTGSHFGKGIFNLAGAWLAPNGDAIVIVLFGSASNDSRYADFRAILRALQKDHPALAVPAPSGAIGRAKCPA